MNVLLLTWDYPPAKGGIQTWMFELARRIPDAHITVLAPASAGDVIFDASANVRVRRLRAAWIGQRAWLFQLLAITIARCVISQPDLIVCGHVVTAPVAILARCMLGVPYVVLCHAYEIRRKRRRRLIGLLLRQAALVLANSRFTECAVLSHGVSRARVRILYPGVDPERFAAEGKGREMAEAPWLKRILSVSRLTDFYKGHDTVIRTLPLIKAKYPDTQYFIAGEGRLRGYLQRLARSLGVERDVIFLGELRDSELNDFYRSCDVLVQMSREARSGGGAEGFGIVCLEAGASGIPVVAGRSGGLPDAVVDGVTGLLVDPEDYGEIAEAIASVLADRELAQRLGRAGRERVVRELTWDHMAARARTLLAEAAGKARV